MKESLEMRAILANYFDKTMGENEKLMFVDADLAKASKTYDLRKKYPTRAIDVGIAEQNMASIAAGLSSYGYIPYIHTFAPFATRRICDQIMISIAYAKQNVKIIGSDPGISAEYNGGTHMPFEDIGVIRSIPNMIIYEPTDNKELAKALPQITEYYGPVYIRLFRKQCEMIHADDNFEFDLFKAEVIVEGKDVSILASGIMVESALEAAKELKKEDILAEVIIVHTVKPIDSDTIIKSAKKTNCVVTCENHNTIGGLRSAVAEVLSENYPVNIQAIGVQDKFGQVGLMQYLRDSYNMNVSDIVQAARKAISLK